MCIDNVIWRLPHWITTTLERLGLIRPKVMLVKDTAAPETKMDDGTYICEAYLYTNYRFPCDYGAYNNQIWAQHSFRSRRRAVITEFDKWYDL